MPHRNMYCVLHIFMLLLSLYARTEATEQCEKRSYHDRNMDGCVECGDWPDGCTSLDDVTLANCLRDCKEYNLSTTDRPHTPNYNIKHDTKSSNDQTIAGKSSNDQMISGIIGGIVVAAMLLVLLGVYILYKKRRRAENVNNVPQQNLDVPGIGTQHDDEDAV